MTEGRPLHELLVELRNAEVDSIGLTSLGYELRQWRDSASDIAALVGAWTDPEIARWNAAPSNTSVEAASKWISGTSGQHTLSPTIDLVLTTASRDGAADVVLGELGLQIDHDRSVAEVGFWVASEHRRSGVGAILLVCSSWLVNELAIDNAFAVTHATNSAANQLLDSARWPRVATTTTDRNAYRCPPHTPRPGPGFTLL